MSQSAVSGDVDAVLFDLGNTLVSYYWAEEFAPILDARIDCLLIPPGAPITSVAFHRRHRRHAKPGDTLAYYAYNIPNEGPRSPTS